MRRFALWSVLVLALAWTPAASAGAGPPVWSLRTAWNAIAQGISRYGTRVVGDAVASASGSSGPVFTLAGRLAGIAVRDRASLEPPSEVSVRVYLRARGSPGPYRYLVAKGAAGCIVGASYALYTGPSGGLMFYVSQNDGLSYARSPDAGSAIWDDRWHLAVGTYDGHAVHLYVDGKEVGAGTPLAGPIGYGLVGSNDVFLGRIGTCPGTQFSGSIAGLAIWRRALTRPEVTHAYDIRVTRERPVTPPTGFGHA